MAEVLQGESGRETACCGVGVVVLDTLLSIEDPARVRFWRDHQQREVDFVVPRTRSAVDAYERKWSALHPDTKNLRAFRAAYPDGRNFLVVPQLAEPVPLLRDGLPLELVTPRDLVPNQV